MRGVWPWKSSGRADSPGVSHVAYIAVGSNLVPESHIEAALGQLAACTALLGVSRFYRTPAIGRTEQPDYLNGVVKLGTGLSVRALKFELLRGVEANLGRVRSADRFAARPIDLDILLFDSLVVAEGDLVLPDPDLLQRPFLCAALLDCWPDAVLPDGTPVRGLFAPEVLAALKPAQAFSAQLAKRFFP